LLAVLVVVAMLSLAAYSFSQLMVTESRASRQFAMDAQARELANSAIDYVAALLGDPEDELSANLYHNPAAFSQVVVVTSDVAEGEGWFSLAAPVESDTLSQSLRAGLINESGKLNVNAILSYELDEETAALMLLPIPGMTDELADSVLDWIDSDDERRLYGAESDVYQAMTPPYYAKNGPLESVDELLLVAGVTPELLYGEDANRNGLLDPNENDGDLSLPADNADGVLERGWVNYLTVHSRESNLRPDGSTKIDLNQPLLTELYDQLELEYGEELAVFITAYRLEGATNVEPLPTGGLASDDSTGDVQTDEALQNMATSFAKMLAGGGEGNVTRGGLDLSQGASVDIESLYELLGAEVQTTIDGAATTLTSPFSEDAESIDMLFENFSTVSSTVIEGRINVNQAPAEVLMCIPDIPLDLPDTIVAARPLTTDGAAADEVMAQRTNTGWILLEGLADLTTMRMIDRYTTGGGDVHRLQAIGRFSGAGPTARVEAVIDASEEVPRVLFRRDLSELGPGYRLDQLQGTANPL
jgi:type II secretory pathway component PulK